MIARLLVLVALVAAASCDDTTTGDTDFGVVMPGCYGPSSCWKVNCDCLRGDVPNCHLCDPSQLPNGGPCDCNLFTNGDGGFPAFCGEQSQVCVGHAQTTCPGAGARCLPAGSTCAMSGGDPPDIVSSVEAPDASPGLEARCAFADDVCCPAVSLDAGP